MVAQPLTSGVALAAALAAALGLGVDASSVYLAERCRGGTCTDPKFPILDFDQERGECVCRAHPCWDNNGVSHTCSASSGFPFLHFTYSANRTLSCSCSSVPQYDSLHVSRDMCAGEFCDSSAFPILDWDSKQQKCFCRAHPCWDQRGVRHECKDRNFPILHYREDFNSQGAAEPKCECVARLEKRSIGLRGARASGRQQKSFGTCTFSKHTPPRSSSWSSQSSLRATH